MAVGVLDWSLSVLLPSPPAPPVPLPRRRRAIAYDTGASCVRLLPLRDFEPVAQRSLAPVERVKVKKVPEGRMRGGPQTLNRPSLRSGRHNPCGLCAPSSGAARHLLPQGEKGTAERPVHDPICGSPATKRERTPWGKFVPQAILSRWRGSRTRHRREERGAEERGADFGPGATGTSVVDFIALAMPGRGSRMLEVPR